jgi:cell division protein FtsX
MTLSGFGSMGLFISLLFIIVVFAVISFVIRYSIDNSKLTKEIIFMRKELEELRNELKGNK